MTMKAVIFLLSDSGLRRLQCNPAAMSQALEGALRDARYGYKPADGTLASPIGGRRRQARGRYRLTLFDEQRVVLSAKSVLVEVLRLLAWLDHAFLPQLAEVKARKRRIIAKCPEDVYPGRPDLAKYSDHIADGWWVGTNYSKRDIQRILKIACSVAGIEFGRHLCVDPC